MIPSEPLHPESASRLADPAQNVASKRLAKKFAWFLIFLIPILVLAAIGSAFYARNWIRNTTRAALPQIDGNLAIPGISAPVSVQRDAHGRPHLRAANLDDLILAQGFVTAQDRLWQMDMLRRHAAGELAAILGPSLLAHDKTQRTLQIRAAADRAIAILPADQLHWLDQYAKGVNAAIDQMKPAEKRASRLPIEFRILRYEPAPWTPRDTLLVSLAMFQDLTNAFPEKLAREALTARLPPQLAADLYPTGSWRDHPPASTVIDLTVEGPPIEDIPLDESQSVFAMSAHPDTNDAIANLRSLHSSLGVLCPDCVAGSNNWVVAGTRTASGKPLLSNDMHLHITEPESWYQIALEAPAGLPGEPFDVAGLSLPGAPFIIVGHNWHVAWGFTNLFADVQDLYLEDLRGRGAEAEFRTFDAGGNEVWQPVLHRTEVIHVHSEKDVDYNVSTTRHGDAETPILTPILPKETRNIALRWTAYDPSLLTSPFFAINSAYDWPSFTKAFEGFGGPGQNVVYADDQGHIGYHAVGRVPIRGPHLASSPLPAGIAAPAALANGGSILPANPGIVTAPEIVLAPAPQKPQVTMIGSPISGVPVHATPQNEWSGYIPFAELPQVFDPVSGILATANSRVTPDDYPYPFALNWAAPYRNERIWRALIARDHLTSADMLALQSDVYSDFNRVLAQRFSYAIDHSHALATESKSEQKKLQQAADILRKWNGRMDTDAAAPAIVSSAHAALWEILLSSHVTGSTPPKDIMELYLWNQKDYALEQIVTHEPVRWLPNSFATWDDLLASAVEKGLANDHAPADLSQWRYGRAHVFEVEHPIFEKSRILQRLLGLRIGTGPHAIAGDHTTIKQTDRGFGPSERMTVDFADLDRSTLNTVLGQSGNPASPWFLDQFPAWYRGTTFALPFTQPAVDAVTTHTLTLQPR